MTQTTRRVTRSRPIALRTALLTCSLALVPAAGAQDVRIFKMPEGGERQLMMSLDADRPMIGVTTASGSDRADTLGLRIESVREGSPAAKAGLKAGDRLVAVNGTSLRADRADAGEEDYAGVLNRRLVRAVQATAPGQALTLRVLSGGAMREVRVVPVKASELEGERRSDWRVAGPSDDRAVLGVTVASTGTPRDTLGVFVQSVVTGGPAERAGIVEGDRIAAINGVSLRVAREDADDEAVGAARAERLSREVAKLKAGDAAELTVVTAGRTRTVRVTTVRAGELPEEFRGAFRMPEMEGLLRMLPRERGMPEVRPLPARPDEDVIIERDAPRIRIRTLEPGTTRERAVPRPGTVVVRRAIRTEA